MQAEVWVDRVCKLRYGWTGFAGVSMDGHAGMDGERCGGASSDVQKRSPRSVANVVQLALL